MFLRSLCVFAVLVGVCACGNEEEDVQLGAPSVPERLSRLDGVTAKRIGFYTDGSIVFDMLFTQPVDHNVTGGETFQQRVIVRYAPDGYRGPVVMITDGYELQYFEPESLRIGYSEPTWMFNAVQVEVEHRYFSTSIPANPDWSKLDIAQAAADHHHIYELLATVFTGPWIATGVSKSGVTALLYEYFYPDDMVGVVAYVAPTMDGPNDQRYVDVLQRVGDAACRAALDRFQRDVLSTEPREGGVTESRRDAMERLFRDEYGRYGLSVLGEGRAFEFMIVELPFWFWQYSDAARCALVPATTASDEEFFAFISETISPYAFTDEDIAASQPSIYQRISQLGDPGSDEARIVDLLRYPGEDTSRAYLTVRPVPAYDPLPMQRFTDWAATSSQHVVLVYGEWDPWTAGAIDLGSGRDTFRFTAPRANHGAWMLDLAPADAAVATAALERWVGAQAIDLNAAALTLGAQLKRRRF